MADFPILKWMQVDGRSVPFTYPQHQKGNGYVVTGEDNPLPTGNHVMTESGIWVPQRGTDEGAAHTQLTGSNVEKLSIGAVTTTRTTNSINGIHIDGGGTGIAPKLGSMETKSLVSVSGAGKGITLRIATDAIEQDSGIELVMDGRRIIRVASGSSIGRYVNFASLDRLGINEKGDEAHGTKIVKWDTERNIYVIDVDLSKFGYFQSGMDLSLINNSNDDVALTALAFYQIVSSPNVTFTSPNEVDVRLIRDKLSRNFMVNVDSFTVVRQLNESDDNESGYMYDIFYRSDIYKADLKNFIEGILN